MASTRATLGKGVRLLHGEEAEDGKHGGVAVLELGLAENLNAEVENVREAEGVETNIAGILATESGEVQGPLDEGPGRRPPGRRRRPPRTCHGPASPASLSHDAALARTVTAEL